MDLWLLLLLLLLVVVVVAVGFALFRRSQRAGSVLAAGGAKQGQER